MRSRRRWPLRGAALGLVGVLLGGLVAVTSAVDAAAAQDPTSCGTRSALQNGGFELPVIPDDSDAFLPESSVPGWRTTATDEQIEIWRSPYWGVTAGSGSQFAELNATQASTLYQDVATTPGQTLRWELQHRGRQGTDVMAVNIGRPGMTLVRQASPSDGDVAWGTHSGLYTVPAGQTTTRFAFQAVSTGSNDPTIGNFIDSISFGTSACLVTTTAVTTGSGRATADVGELLTYTVTTGNGGGNPATGVVITDRLPDGVEFVPGSIRAGTSMTRRTDAVGDDTGEYDAAAREVRVRVGPGAGTTAGGTIRPDEARSISYQVRVTEGSSATTVRNAAQVRYRDSLTASTRTSTSNEVATPVAAAADLTVAVARTTPQTVAGTAVSWTVTTRNDGPSAEPAARTRIDLPTLADGTPGLTGVTATTAGGGSCTVGSRTVTCDHGSLVVGASRGTTVTGTVPAGTPPGAVYRLSASVTGTAHDHVPGDNTASVAHLVTARADLGVDLAADTDTATAGVPVTYTAVVTNAGPSVAQAVVLTDLLGEGMRFDSASAGDGGSCTYDSGANTVRCALGDLAPGATRTVVVRATPASGTSRTNNAVSVTSPTPDPAGEDNQEEDAGNVTDLADLSVDLQLPDTSARPGDTVPFTVLVANDGPSDAVNVAVQTVLPSGFEVTRLTGITCTATAGCRLERVRAGETVTITGDARVLPDAPEGTTTVRTRVVSATPDGNADNDVDEVTVTVVLEADLELTQVLESPDDPGGPLVAGGPLHATATVRNAGPTRAEGVVLRQVVPAGQPVPTWDPGPGRCAVEGTVDADGVAVDGAVVVCTLDVLAAGAPWVVHLSSSLPASYEGSDVTTVWAVTSSTEDPDVDDDTSRASSPVVRRSDVRMGKTTSTPSVVQTGAVAFTVTVTNDGPSDARDVLVREAPRPGVLVTGAVPGEGTYSPSDGAWRIPYLAVGRSATMQVDGRAEAPQDVVNDARFVSAGSVDPQPGNDLASATVAVRPADRSLTVATRATVEAPGDRAAGLRLGDVLTFAYDVTNPGNVAMGGIAVTDTLLPGGVTCPRTTLAPGDAMTCTANGAHRVTQADVDAGHDVGGVAEVRGRAPDSTADLVFGPATDRVRLAEATSSLDTAMVADWDDADGDGALDAGERVVWTVVVTNTGELTVSSLRVESTGAPTPTCPVDLLAPGARTSCVTPAVTLTSADVAAGQRQARARALGVQSRGNVPVAAAPSETRFPAEPAPALGLTVDGVVDPAGRQSAAALGDRITWRYVVTNLGNVHVDGVAVDAPAGGPATCAATGLDPGDSTTCTAGVARTVTEDDLLAGAVTGRATATGIPAAVGGLVRSAQAEDVVGLAGIVRALVVTTAALAPDGTLGTGDPVGWTHRVHNDGNLTVRLVEVDDELVGPAACEDTVLAPGERTDCTSGGTYRVTQGDFDAGRVANAARASGIPAGSDTPMVFGPASAPVRLAAATPGLSVVHVADWRDDGDDTLDAGETIDWSVLVTNTGDVTLGGLTVAAPPAGAVTCPVATLAPGEQTTCTAAQYTVTAADVTAGTVDSTATAAADDPRGGPRVTSAPSSTRSPSTPDAALALAVHPVTGTPDAPDVGDEVRWRYTVTNVGNVPVAAPAVTDPGDGAVTCTATTLLPGASTTCLGSAVTVVREEDVRTGELGRSATATATSPRDTSVRPGSGTGRVHLAPVVRLLAVTAAATGRADAPGDEVAYTWTVRNAGNVTMTAVDVTDSAGGTPACAATSLAPGATTTCTGGSVYRVTQADLDAGLPVGLTATATALPATGTDRLASGPAADAVPVGPVTARLTATKTGGWDDDGDGALDEGEAARWSVLVANTGTVTVEDLRVEDPRVFVGCPAAVLGPGESVVCRSDDDPVSRADAEAGSLSNTATAHAVSRRDGAPVPSAPSTAAVTTTPAPALTLVVEALRPPRRGTAPLDLGDTVGWRYHVTSTGNVAVGGVVVEVPGTGPVACAAASLAPGATATCTAPARHRIGEDDLLAGGVGTTGMAAGTAALTGAAVRSAPSTASVATAAPRGALQLALGHERVDGTAGSALRLGDLVRIRYRVTNTGTLTLTDVAVTDPVAGPVVCGRTVLAPAEATDCAASRPRAVTAEDVAAGHLTSWATVAAATSPASGLGTVGSAATATDAVLTTPGPPDPPGSPEPPATPGPPGTPGTPGEPDAPAAPAPAAPAPAPAAPAPAVATLARTGGEPLRTASVAAVLLVAGATLLLASRRRPGT